MGPAVLLLPAGIILPYRDLSHRGYISDAEIPLKIALIV